MKKQLLLSFFFSIPLLANTIAQTLPVKAEIIGKMKLANDYWLAQNAVPGNNQWARAVYFTGNLDFYKTYSKAAYLQYANLWANNNGWALNGGTATRNADNQTCGQVYIDLYNMDAAKDPTKIVAIKTSIDNMVNGTVSNDWWWVDALYMAMPVFTRLGVLTNDSIYFQRMYDIYTNTKVTRGLFNTTEGLWYRDETYKPPYKTTNGQDCYWSRGNGWVLGAHVRVLQLLPQKNSHRAEFVQTFQQMAAALKSRQRADGFWNPSLDDANEYTGPETSGTAFFTYGLAWGINNHLLDSTTYYPVVAKAWNGLTTIALQPNGFLGYVQGVGSAPGYASATNTVDYGVGALLLAGTELVKMAKGSMPVPTNFAMQSVTVLDKTHIQVAFTKKTDATTALQASNYQINNGVTISAVAKGSTDSTTLLTVSGLYYGAFQLQLSNIQSADGVQIEAGETKTFTYTGIAQVTASGYEAGTSNTPDKTLDFDLATRWSAQGVGQWILYDLGETKLVNSVDLAFYNGDVRKSYFTINLSTNGTTFAEVLSATTSGTSAKLENYDFVDQNARYVKISCNGNSVSLWNSITEARINFTDKTLGVKQLNNQTIPVLYPNPLIGSKLTICLTESTNQSVRVRISDLTGKTVFAETLVVTNRKVVIPSLSLNQGAYTVSIIANNKLSEGLLLVKAL